jgi:hypothetical protein
MLKVWTAWSCGPLYLFVIAECEGDKKRYRIDHSNLFPITTLHRSTFLQHWDLCVGFTNATTWRDKTRSNSNSRKMLLLVPLECSRRSHTVITITVTKRAFPYHCNTYRCPPALGWTTEINGTLDYHPFPPKFTTSFKDTLPSLFTFKSMDRQTPTTTTLHKTTTNIDPSWRGQPECTSRLSSQMLIQSMHLQNIAWVYHTIRDSLPSWTICNVIA